MRRLLLVTGLSAVPAAALAAAAPDPVPADEVRLAGVQPSAAPAPFTAQQRAAVEADEGTLSARPIRQTNVGTWTRYTALDPVRTYDAVAVPVGTLPVRMSAADVMLNYNQRKVALRINDGLDRVGADVPPELVDAFGLDHLDLIGSLKLYEYVGNCNTYRLKLRNVFIEVPLTSRSVDGHFETGREVKSDFDVPGAVAHAELEWTITDNGCFIDIIPSMDIEASFTVSDLSGHLDATLGTDGDAIQIDDIDSVSLTVGDFDWAVNSWFLNTVIACGFALYDLFDFSCSGQADCLTEAVNEYALDEPELIDALAGVVNDAIDAPLSISSGTSTDGFSMGINVDLASIKSSTTHDTLTSLWNVTLSSTGVADACASRLTARAYAFEGSTGDASLTGDDLELELPFHLISRAAYFAGQQGVFCQSFSKVVGARFYRFSLAPVGSVAIAGAAAGEPENTLKLSMPVEITANAAGSGGVITGTVTVTGRLEVDGGQDLVFSPTTADVSGIAGTITIGALSFPAASLEAQIDAAAGDIVGDLGDLELLNAVVDTGIGSLSVSIGEDILTSGAALVVGLDLDR